MKRLYKLFDDGRCKDCPSRRNIEIFGEGQFRVIDQMKMLQCCRTKRQLDALKKLGHRRIDMSEFDKIGLPPDIVKELSEINSPEALRKKIQQLQQQNQEMLEMLKDCESALALSEWPKDKQLSDNINALITKMES